MTTSRLAPTLTAPGEHAAAEVARIEDVRVGDVVVGTEFTLPVVSVNYQGRLVILGHRGYPTVKRVGDLVRVRRLRRPADDYLSVPDTGPIMYVGEHPDFGGEF